MNENHRCRLVTTFRLVDSLLDESGHILVGAHGVSSDLRRDYVRVSIPKSNYGPPLEPFWLRRSAKFEGIFEYASLSTQPRKQT